MLHLKYILNFYMHATTINHSKRVNFKIKRFQLTFHKTFSQSSLIYHFFFINSLFCKFQICQVVSEINKLHLIHYVLTFL